MVFALAVVPFVACSAGGGGEDGPGSGNGAGNNNGGNGSGGLGGGLPPGMGGSIIVLPEAGPVGDGGLRPKRCDDAGNCSCINLAAIGLVKGEANENDTTAFQTWLNTKSTANVTMIAEKPTLTPEFLQNYDVIVLQVLGDSTKGPFWNFTAEEVAALTTWVQDGGGGLITLTGYGADIREVDPVNNLLAFSGISYNTDDVLGTGTCPEEIHDPDGDGPQVGQSYQPCYCWANSIPVGGWDAAHPVSKNITRVGALHGRSINPGDATVIASDGTTVYAAGKQVGAGKVFAYADEWPIYTNQWLVAEEKLPPTPEQAPHERCWDMEQEHWRFAANEFQVPQFWYNVINWAAPPSECTFVIDDDRIKLE